MPGREQQVGDAPAGRAAASIGRRSPMNASRSAPAMPSSGSVTTRRRRCRRPLSSTAVARRRVDERQAGARLAGDVVDLARGEMEVDGHRARLAQRGGCVDEQRRRAVAGDHQHAARVGRDRTPAAPPPTAASRRRAPTTLAPPWPSDRIAHASGSVVGTSPSERQRRHRASTEQTLMPGAPYTCVNAVRGLAGNLSSPARPASCWTHSTI